MHLLNILSLSLSAVGTYVLAQNSTATTGLGDAIVVTNNPVGKEAVAMLPDKPFFTSGGLDGNVKGAVKALPGRVVSVSTSSLDPFIRGEDPACNSSQPASCQVGDLSGKYGKITSDPFTAKFRDNFTAMNEGPGSYFLNRSLVVHFANKTRITCANFAVLDCPANNGTAATNGTSSCQYSSTPTPTNTAKRVRALTVKSLALIPIAAILFGA
ncbi:hypothetical protein CIB48_g1135 [Xylaria polymorpha]|nr:hypothetical protein CIB48_g1135 [Xylaria polymorpha]